MAITDINISEQLETDAPSIKYTGNEGPQASPQHQQEMQIAQQIWEALGPEQQGQFQSFEQFFQSGVWKQILQQMQQDEEQGPETQQGIGSLGPQPMEQQMPMPNRMGAQYGGRMGYSGGGNYEAQVQQLMDQGLSRPMAEFLAGQGISTELKAQGGRMGYAGGEMVEGITEGVEKVGRGGSEIIEKIKEGIISGGDRAQGLPGMDESIWIEKLIEHLRKKRDRGRPDPRRDEREPRDPREEFMPEWDSGPLRPLPRRPIRPLRPFPRRPRGPVEDIREEQIGIESLRGRR
jgi:hypothetical protein